MNRFELLLENYRTEGSKVFTGRDRGIKVRNSSRINELETEYEFIDIIIPENIRSINPSFLEEFLNDIVIKLKPEEFHRRISFISHGKYDIAPDLDEAIESILREETSLA